MDLSGLPRSARLSCHFVFAIVLLTICAACGKVESKSETGAGTDFKADAPITVATGKAVAREIPSFIQATGSLVADETSDIAAKVAGKIVATPVNVGAFVKQGDVIARLDDKDARLRLAQERANVSQVQTGVAQAQARLGLNPGGNFQASTIPEVLAANANYEQLQAQLRQAEANEARYRDLVQTGDVAMSVYEQYRTTRDTARAQLRSAQEQLNAAVNTAKQSNQAVRAAQAAVESARAQQAVAEQAINDAVIRAPYSGFISARPTALGEYVSPTSIIATLLRSNPIKLQLNVDESAVPFLRQGMAVSVSLEAYKDRKFAGTITAVNPLVDQTSRTAIVEAEIENSSNALRPGMFATARITRPGGGNGIFVPTSAVFNDQNTQSYRSFVIQNGVAKLRVVQIGQEENDQIQILSGLNADDTVATSNLAQLYEGARIQQ